MGAEILYGSISVTLAENTNVETVQGIISEINGVFAVAVVESFVD